MSPSLALRCPLLPRILLSRSLPDVTPWLWTKTVSKINFFSLSSSLSQEFGYTRENSLHSGIQFLRDKRCNTQLLVNSLLMERVTFIFILGYSYWIFLKFSETIETVLASWRSRWNCRVWKCSPSHIQVDECRSLRSQTGSQPEMLVLHPDLPGLVNSYSSSEKTLRTCLKNWI